MATEQEIQEQNNKAALEIIKNDTPENREKYPELFKKAEEMGILNQVKQTAADPVLSEIKSRFGDGYESKEDFFAKVEEWKKQGSTLSALSSLPEPIIEGIRLFSQGKDWVEAFKSVKVVDFTKNYTEDELLNIYMPNKFTKEELEDTENIAVKKARQQAKQYFELDKQSDANQKMLAQDRFAQQEKHAKNTLENTIEDFKKKAKLLNPDIKPEVLSAWESRIRTELTSGNFQQKFLDGKGGYTEEAASNLFPLVYPTEFTAQWKNAGRQGAEKDVFALIDRGGKPESFDRKQQPVDTNKMNAKKLVDAFSTGEKLPWTATPVKQ